MHTTEQAQTAQNVPKIAKQNVSNPAGLHTTKFAMVRVFHGCRRCGLAAHPGPRAAEFLCDLCTTTTWGWRTRLRCWWRKVWLRVIWWGMR